MILGDDLKQETRKIERKTGQYTSVNLIFDEKYGKKPSVQREVEKMAKILHFLSFLRKQKGRYTSVNLNFSKRIDFAIEQLLHFFGKQISPETH